LRRFFRPLASQKKHACSAQKEHCGQRNQNYCQAGRCRCPSARGSSRSGASAPFDPKRCLRLLHRWSKRLLSIPRRSRCDHRPLLGHFLPQLPSRSFAQTSGYSSARTSDHHKL
jgi:hypothetical protein